MTDLDGLVNVADVEAAAAGLLDEGLLGYYAGGAGDERTLRENVAAYGRRRLRPRVLVDVGDVSTATTVLGADVSMPVLVAPTALHRMAHPDGEPGMARAAAAAGTVYCLSTLATSRPSEVAASAPAAPRWFQVYAFRDRGVTKALVEEAVRARLRRPGAHRRRSPGGPARARPADRLQRAAGVDMPAVRAATGAPECPTPAEFFSLLDRSLDWRAIAELREHGLPVVVKGIQTGEDAALAAEHGADAVVVSNHGGRQLDGVAASIDVLPEAVAAVDGRVEVYVDGGVRRGTDVLVALALGARAVLIGRPALWGLAVGGEAGARHVLELLRAELELAQLLLGCPRVADVTPAHVG